MDPEGMTRGRRLTVAVALALVPALLAVPSHAETADPGTTPTPTATEAPPSEPIESTPPPQTEPTSEPTTAAPDPAPPVKSTAARTTAKRVAPARVAPSTTRKKSSTSTGRWVSIRLNSGSDKRFYTRENFWLRGKVLTTSGRAHAGAKVKIYRDTKKGRTRLATVRTSKNGWYHWSPKTPRGGKYRAVVSKVRYSPKIAFRKTTGTRTLASRQKSLGFLLGSPTTGVRRSGKLAWREYRKGILIQRGSRTWVVRGAIVKKVRAHGGPAGELGAPTGDVRCGLPEKGCLQQFRTGAVYVNKKAKKKLTSAVAPKLGAADLVAVARSQVGYREKAPRQSKYNKWLNRTGAYDPWCGFFVSWLAHAAGKPGAVLKKRSFPALLAAERKRGRTSSKARVGRLAYIGYFSKGRTSHVGIVSKVSGDYVWTIEGNVSAGGGMAHPRGVHLVKRHKSNVVFYADPRY